MVDSCVRVVLSPGVNACVENKCKNWYYTNTCIIIYMYMYMYMYIKHYINHYILYIHVHVHVH